MNVCVCTRGRLIDSEPRFPFYRSTSTRFSHLVPAAPAAAAPTPKAHTTPHPHIYIYTDTRTPSRPPFRLLYIHARVYSVRSSNKVPGFLNVFIVLSNSVRARHSRHLISYLPIGRQYINSRIRLSHAGTQRYIYI